MHLEILWGEPQGGLRRRAQHRIHHGARQVDIERFPEDIGSGLFQTLATGATPRRTVLTELVTPQRGKDIEHSFRGNLPNTPRCQSKPILALADVALLLQLLSQVL